MAMKRLCMLRVGTASKVNSIPLEKVRPRVLGALRVYKTAGAAFSFTGLSLDDQMLVLEGKLPWYLDQVLKVVEFLKDYLPEHMVAEVVWVENLTPYRCLFTRNGTRIDKGYFGFK